MLNYLTQQQKTIKVMSSNRLNRVITTLSHRKDNVSVILYGVYEPHNLSAIIRNCAAAGVPNVHAFETPDQKLRTYQNATADNEKYIELTAHNRHKIKFLTKFKKK
jgi:tRNA (guanosine-2'-O-)-methyltransferase